MPISFNTGKPHQAAIASWVRQRLADSSGRVFHDGVGSTAAQAGCLLADGVGFGKTWEALASSAVLLAHRESDRRRDRKKGGGPGHANMRRQAAHVLIIVPPGLVSKWAGELFNPNGFRKFLSIWAGRRQERNFILDSFDPSRCYEIRSLKDVEKLPPFRKVKGGYQIPRGVYICNWNVLSKESHGASRLSRLKSQAWEVVIVDEAHHREARAALEVCKAEARAFKLLLTATPFQLSPQELHGLTHRLVKSDGRIHKLLSHGPVKAFSESVVAAFGGAGRPSKDLRLAAEGVLRQLIASSRVGDETRGRSYHVINDEGSVTSICAPLSMGEREVSGAFQNSICPTAGFSKWYVQSRLNLAMARTEGGQPHVSMELRKLLSISKGAPDKPKWNALRLWARRQFPKDLALALQTGLPQKLLVFSYLKDGVVEPLAKMLGEELLAAYASIRDMPEWVRARSDAKAALSRIVGELRNVVPKNGKVALGLVDELAVAVENSLYFDLMGNPAFAGRVEKELRNVIGEVVPGLKAVGDGDEEEGVALWRAYQAGKRRREARRVLAEIAKVKLSSTYCGDDTRTERDAVAEAFKMVLSPWVLVATNVGSEGIDLHRYTQHLVHFDLEWNPARLEQREGRIDRLGRELGSPAAVYFLLVKGTYDERMFHQLVARQRWHGILLGKKAKEMDSDEEIDAPLIERREAEGLSLDLTPR